MTHQDHPPFGNGDSSFQAAGGIEGIRQLVEDFYAVMDSVPEAASIRQMYPPDLTLAREKLATFLCGWLGGPRVYAERYGPINIPQFHRSWSIGALESQAWMACMAQALARQDYHPAFSRYLLQQLQVPAARIQQASSRTSGCPAHP